MIRSAVSLACVVAVWSCACRGPQPVLEPDPGATPGDLRQACAALHHAPPGTRGPHLRQVFAAGTTAEPFLLAEFAREPAAAGAQATIALLGRIGGTASVDLCRRLVAERAPLAVEAALALATLPTTADDRVLLDAVQDRQCDAALRAAAACSLARHGEREHALRMILAIVRAGTPAGIEDERELGLPARPRWARERYFVQRLLQQLGHDDLLRELDSDASWPALEALAPRVADRLRSAAPAAAR